MTILNKSKEEIRQNIIRMLREEGTLTDLTPGSALSTVVDIIVDRVDDLFDQLSVANAMAHISTATGPFLDLHARTRGLSRRQATAASVLGGDRIQKFYVTSGFLIDYIPSGVIPAETIVSNPDQNVAYRVTRDVVFGISDREIFVPITAVQAGTFYNVGANILTTHNLFNNNVFTTNAESISNGQDTEADDSLRFRIVSTGSSTTPGSFRAVTSAAFNDPAVSDVNVRRHVQGVGTIGVELTPIGNSIPDSAVRNVQTQVAEVLSYGNRAVVFSAFPITVSLTAAIRVDDAITGFSKSNIAAEAEVAIANYISSIPKGGEFVINGLISDVIESSDLIIDTKLISLCIDGEEQAIRNFRLERDEFFRLDERKVRSIQVFV